MAINLKVLTGQLVFLFVFFCLVLFVSAGTVAWLNGWIFLVLFFGFVLITTLWLYKYNPSLLRERMTMTRSDQQSWDKKLFPFINAAFLLWMILMPLDAVRFHWSAVPIWLPVVAIIILIGSFYLFFATFRENSYLSPMARVQHDRGQTVVSSGPYHYVRHPMYAAMLLFLLGTPLLLGSWYGLLVGLPLLGLMATRAVLEEHMLRQDLQGYDVYMTQVKYRLIPHIW